jgi:hypothetical protein
VNELLSGESDYMKTKNLVIVFFCFACQSLLAQENIDEDYIRETLKRSDNYLLQRQSEIFSYEDLPGTILRSKT